MIGSSDLMDARLADVRDLTPTVREFVIEPAQPVAPYEPGSHILIEVNIAGRADRRSYSVVRQSAGAICIAVKRVEPGRGGSRWMYGLAPGAPLRVSHPRNNFALSPNGAAYLLVAGGIGVTPIRGMASVLQRRGCSVRMLYAARSAEELAFAEELRAELGAALAVFIEDEGQRFDLAAEFAALPASAEAYVCGPHGLLMAAQRAWSALGRDPTRLRYETFGAGGGGEQRPFVVRMATLDREVPVAPGQSMLDALEDAGIAMLSGCRKGECGVCVLEVTEVEGQLDHQDVFLSEAQRRQGARICACVSRATGGRLTVREPRRSDAPFALDQARGLAWNGVRLG